MEQLTNVYKLLSDETRLRIILLLYQEDLCVCEFTGILNVTQPKISKNLAKLRDMNLVDSTRKDKFVFYTLKDDGHVFFQTLDVILEHIHDYPVLLDDQQRLAHKENYLDQCSLKALSKLA